MTLTILGLALDIVGVVFISVALAFTSDNLIRAQSATTWNFNRTQLRELVSSRTDARIGLPILIAGFTLQGVGAIFKEPIAIYLPAMLGAGMLASIVLLIIRILTIEKSVSKLAVLLMTE